MARLDQFGVAHSTHDAQALRSFDSGLAKLLVFNHDPIAEADAALAADPTLVMAYVLKGVLFALSTERPLLPLAMTALESAQKFSRDATTRERGHVAALEACTQGRLRLAADHWEAVLASEPRDALAMFAAHQTDFLCGRSQELRDRVGRRLAAVGTDARLSGYYQGMHAFGLEEMGDYAQALQAGQRAVAADPKDAWAVHAVAHVFEMTGRVEEGQRWMSERTADWSTNNFLAIHNWWHCALFLCEERRWPEVLGLYDERIRAGDSAVVMNLLDASSLLWRLTLQKVEVGNRWERLVELWEPHLGEAWYAFNDLHAMMVFAAAGRSELTARLLEAMHAASRLVSDNGEMTRTVGLPVAAALLAFTREEYGEAAAILEPLVAKTAIIGGSHAQRDLIVQTLTASAERAGRTELARSLVALRLAHKPASPLSRAWMQRLSGVA